MSSIEVLGNNATARVLDYFTTWGKDFDADITHIANSCDLSWKHTKKIIKTLEENGIITKTRNVGRAEMYKLAKNEKTKALMRLIFLLDKEENDKIVEKELITA